MMNIFVILTILVIGSIGWRYGDLGPAALSFAAIVIFLRCCQRWFSILELYGVISSKRCETWKSKVLRMRRYQKKVSCRPFGLISQYCGFWWGVGCCFNTSIIRPEITLIYRMLLAIEAGKTAIKSKVLHVGAPLPMSLWVRTMNTSLQKLK